MAEPIGLAERRVVRPFDEPVRWILERLPEAVIVVDGEGTLRFANTATSSLFGYAPGELVGRAVELFVPKGVRAHHEALRDEFRKKPARRPMGRGRVFSAVRRDGSLVTVQIALAPIRTTEGVLVVATLLDVAAHSVGDPDERKRHAALVRAHVIEESPVALAMFDRTLTYLAASPAWRAMFTKDSALVVGRTRQEVHRRMPDAWTEVARRALAGESLQALEEAWIRWDGATRWVWWTVYPWTDEDGTIGGIIVGAMDITERKEAAQALFASSARLSQMFHANPVGTVLSRLNDGKIVEVNSAMLELFGFERDEVIGRSSIELGAWPALEEREALFEVLRRQGTARGVDARFRRKSGEIGHGIASAELLEVDGEPHVLGMLMDVTERKRVAAALRASEERFRSVVDQAADGFFVHARDGQLVDVNRYACASLGYEREELLEKNIWDVHELYTDRGQAIAQQVRVGSPITIDGEARRKDGTSFPVEIRLGCIETEGERVLVSLARDVSQRHALERSLESAEERARTDPLTGIANRRHFLEIAEHEWLRARRYRHPAALLMIDLDRFKSINDTYGHQGGDTVLQAFATVALEAMREVDLVGRLGGEEFAALLPEADHEHAIAAAERLRLAAEGAARKRVCGSTIPFTVSIGVALFESTDVSVDCALKRADRSLYVAKRSGRNKVCAT